MKFEYPRVKDLRTILSEVLYNILSHATSLDGVGILASCRNVQLRTTDY